MSPRRNYRRMMTVRDSYGNAAVIQSVSDSRMGGIGQRQSRIVLVQLAGSDFGHAEQTTWAELDNREPCTPDEILWAKRRWALLKG